MIDDLKSFRDSEESGAWPFLVGALKCLLDCDNGRDRVGLLDTQILSIRAFVLLCSSGCGGVDFARVDWRELLSQTADFQVRGSSRRKQVCDALR